MSYPVARPTNITPWMWYDADDATTITTSGSTLTGWRNKGSSGTSSTGTVTGTVTYNTVTTNGRPLISFASGGQFTTNSVRLESQAFSAFIIYSIKTNYDTTHFFMFTQNTGASVTGGPVFYETAYTGQPYNMGCNNHNVRAPLVATSFNANSIGPKMGSWVVSSTNAANNVLANNGMPLTKTTSLVGSGADTTNSYTYIINTSASGAADYGEVLIYTGELTTAQRQNVEGYLAWKWGLQSSLPFNHPYNPYYNKAQQLALPVPLNNDILPWVWYDAADATTIRANNTTLTAWQNKGTSGSTAGGTISGTINTGTTTINGRNIVSLVTTASLTTPSLTPTSQAFAGFWVTRSNRTFTNGLIQLIFSPNTTTRTPQLLLYFDNTNNYQVQGNITGGNRVIAGNQTNFTNQTFLFGVVNSATAANNRVTVNGTVQTLVLSTAAGGATLSADTYTIGGYQDLAELIIYQGEITTTQRYHVEGYLAWKWGLQTSLPSTHPYHPSNKDATLGLYVRPRLFVSTYAGLTGTSGYVNGNLTTARFNNPEAFCVDSAGNFYVAEISNSVIRKIAPDGTVSTLAGAAPPTATTGTTDGIGSAARFNLPHGVALNPAQTILYVADYNNNRIRQIILATGEVSTLAGPNGTTIIAGDTDGTGTNARFWLPIRMAVHPTNGDIYVCDFANNKIRKVTPAGVVTTPYGPSAGTTSSGATDGIGNAARFNGPQGIVFDSTGENLYVCDNGNYKIRKINLSTGQVSTFIGTPNVASSTGLADGFNPDVLFTSPKAVCFDPQGTMFLTESTNANKIREISPAGGVVTIAGPGPTAGTAGTADGMDCLARFNAPHDIVIYNNDFYIVDRLNHSIRRMGLGATNQVGRYATVNNLTGIANDGFGNVYVSTDTHIITRVNIYGTATTFAGLSGTSGSTDGAGGSARFNSPVQIAFDMNYNMYIPDGAGNRIRRMSPAGLVTTFAGSGTAGMVNASGTSAQFNGPRSVFVDKANNIYVGEWSNNRVRRITENQAVTTYVGSGTPGRTDGSGNAYLANLSTMEAITMDSEGNLYCISRGANTVARITPGRVFSNFAGSGTATVTDGTGTGASFNTPAAITVDKHDNLYVTDIFGYTVRRITPSGVVTTIAGLAGNLGNIDGIGSAARFENPAFATIDSAGNLFVVDKNNANIRCIRFYNPGQPVVRSLQTLTLNGATSAITDRNANLGITYQWQKADSLIDTYANITNATNLDYIPVTGDVNAGVRLTATYTNTVGSTVTTLSNPLIPLSVVIPGTPVLVPARPFAWDGFVRYNWQITDNLFTSSVTVACTGPNAETRILPAAAGQTTYTGLTNGSNYTATITATSGGGISSFIASYRDTQPGGVPSVPLTVSMSVENTNRIYVTWKTPTSDGQSPIQWYALTSSDNVYRYGIEGFRREFLTPPLPSGTYTFNLRAINAVGYGSSFSSTLVIP